MEITEKGLIIPPYVSFLTFWSHACIEANKRHGILQVQCSYAMKPPVVTVRCRFVFICLVTRAIHLGIVPNLSTETFIQCLK